MDPYQYSQISISASDIQYQSGYNCHVETNTRLEIKISPHYSPGCPDTCDHTGQKLFV